MTGILRIPRGVALAAIALLVAAASFVSFAESYRGLYVWAAHHGLTGAWAVIWPLQVDVFIAVGELALFVALVDRWLPRARTAAWVVTGIGLAVSVAGNVGHVAGHSLATRVTAAIPPVAAAAALAVGLGVLKRIMESRPGAAGDLSSPVPSTAEEAALESLRRTYLAGNPWKPNGLATNFGLTRAQATRVYERAGISMNGKAPEGGELHGTVRQQEGTPAGVRHVRRFWAGRDRRHV